MKGEERFDKWEKPEIEDGEITDYNWLVQDSENLKLGNYTDVGAFTYINASKGVEIRKNAQIGSHCAIYSKSTIDEKEGKVVIGENAKIGSHSTVMPGVTIGENAKIGAHSFVNKDVPPGKTAYGTPIEIQEDKE